MLHHSLNIECPSYNGPRLSNENAFEYQKVNLSVKIKFELIFLICINLKTDASETSTQLLE